MTGITYGNLSFTNGGVNDKLLLGTARVAGDLTINSGAYFSSGNNNISLDGNWTNNGTFAAGASSSLILNGTAKTIAGNTTFNRMIILGSCTVTAVSTTFNGLLHVTPSGSLVVGTGAVIVQNDFTNEGIMSSAGVTTFSGTIPQTVRLLNAISSTSTGVVNFDGNVSPVLNSTTTPLFATVNINNTSGVTASASWTVLVSFVVGSGATFNGGVSTHNFNGAFTNNGTVTSEGTLNLNPAFAAGIKLSGTGFSSTGLVVFGGAGAATITGAPAVLTNVTIANTHSSGITPPSGWTVGGKFTINSNAVFNAGSFSYTVGGNIESDGTLNGGTSTFTMTSAAGDLSGSPLTTFY
ncbi:MAG: hypothetical protein WKF70_12725, partial [Chitinophagaceae bacterium]